MINTIKDYEKLSEQYNKMLEERNTLIDDLSWYRAKVSRLDRELEIINNHEDGLVDTIKFRERQIVESGEHIMKMERENEKLKESHIKHITNMENYYKDRVQELKEDNKKLERENEKYDKQFTDYIDETNISLNLLSEISQHIGNKPSSSTYKYFRAKLDNLNITEDKQNGL